MDIIKKFGDKVGSEALTDPEKARRLLLTGYRLQEKRLCFFPDKELPSSGQYVARVVMRNIIRALAKPENAAMVSIFVPGELLTAAGLTPYSVEALSCFIAGTRCEQAFLRRTEEEGFPETMCSYHRVFLGAALTGLVPTPKCTIYTNLACDGNMMTFPYLKQKNELPGFYIDVPYEKNQASVKYVADQLRDMKKFLENVTGKKISEEAFNYSKKMHISACDFVADGFREMHAEDSYEAMAEKMVYCIYNGDVSQRIQMAERLAKETEADGGILFAHWGCKGTIGASSLIKNSLESAGLPTMILDGDGCNPANTSDGQVSTRLQAFVEMLEEGKEEKKHDTLRL